MQSRLNGDASSTEETGHIVSTKAVLLARSFGCRGFCTKGTFSFHCWEISLSVRGVCPTFSQDVSQDEILNSFQFFLRHSAAFSLHGLFLYYQKGKLGKCAASVSRSFLNPFIVHLRWNVWKLKCSTKAPKDRKVCDRCPKCLEKNYSKSSVRLAWKFCMTVAWNRGQYTSTVCLVLFGGQVFTNWFQQTQKIDSDWDMSRLVCFESESESEFEKNFWALLSIVLSSTFVLSIFPHVTARWWFLW